MIEKTENPLKLRLQQINIAIAELQKSFDSYSDGLEDCFSLKESGIALEIETTTGTYSYNLEQLKMIKAELESPVHQSLKEVS